MLADGLRHIIALTVDEHFERHVTGKRWDVYFCDDVVDGAVDSRPATFARARLKVETELKPGRYVKDDKIHK